MIRHGWRPGVPATAVQIRAAETRLAVSFPSDYRDYLLYAGGGEPGAFEAWRGLWRVGDLVAWSRRYADTFPGLLAIGNEAFMVYAIDLRRDDRAPIVSLGLSSSVWDDVLEDAGSFLEWLDVHVPK